MKKIYNFLFTSFVFFFSTIMTPFIIFKPNIFFFAVTICPIAQLLQIELTAVLCMLQIDYPEISGFLFKDGDGVWVIRWMNLISIVFILSFTAFSSLRAELNMLIIPGEAKSRRVLLRDEAISLLPFH